MPQARFRPAPGSEDFRLGSDFHLGVGLQHDVENLSAAPLCLVSRESPILSADKVAYLKVLCVSNDSEVPSLDYLSSMG